MPRHAKAVNSNVIISLITDSRLPFPIRYSSFDCSSFDIRCASLQLLLLFRNRYFFENVLQDIERVFKFPL